MKTCRVCGCTETKACMTNSGPCHLVAEDLCNACTIAVKSDPDIYGDLCKRIADATGAQVVVIVVAGGEPDANGFSVFQLSTCPPDFLPEVLRQMANETEKQLKAGTQQIAMGG
jgi:hypothetical protein